MNGYREQLENECLLCEQDAIWTPALEDILREEGVAFRTQTVFGAGLATYVGPIMERTRFFVARKDLAQAQEIVRALFSQTVLEEQDEQETGEAHESFLHVRRACTKDLGRIAEMEVFNYRLNFYPIFRDDAFYFADLSVFEKAAEYERQIHTLFVYDDGAVKGFIQVEDGEIKKLFVEPVLQGNGIGAALLEYAKATLDAQCLWALEKNERAIAFYRRHGFHLSGERKLEEDTTEYLVQMTRQNA